MRFGKLRIRNMGVFRGEHEFDIGGAVGPIVGVTGENGAGKSTMLGLLLGGIYRECPTRGSLLDLATARDSFVEVEVSNGSQYRFRQLCDAVTKKSETLITDGEGRPLVESGKVTEAKAFVAKHFPTLDLVLNSTFGAQKSAGFVGMKPAERKSLLLQLLGVERLERLAEGSRDRAKSHRLKIETLDARLADEQARGGDAAAIGEQLELSRARAAELEAAATDAKAALESAREEERRLAGLRQAADVARARRAELGAALATSKATIADIETRLANCRSIVDSGPEIRAAAEQASALEATLAELRPCQATLTGGLATAEAESRAARESLASVRREKREAEERAQRLTERLADESKVARAAAALPERRAALEAGRSEVTRLEQERQGLVDQRLAGADERIAGLRAGLQSVSENANSEDPRDIALLAGRALDTDDAIILAASEAPARLAAALKAHAEAKAAVLPMEREVADLERAAARGAEFVAARSELVAAKASISDAAGREAAADARAKAAQDACEPLRALIARRQAEIERAEAERGQVSPLAGKLELLSKAEAMLAERERQLDVARGELSELESKIAAAPEPAAPPPCPDVAGLSRSSDLAAQAAREVSAAVAVLEQRHAAALESAGRASAFAAERAGLDEELADWIRLAADLGKDGLQAMVIDAAIPELNHTANELLRSAFGPRFTIDVRTQAADSKGKRLLETLDVVVFDSELGREAQAETLSGGELVWISDALSLALTVIACRQSGIERPTIVRDESGAALSEGKAALWISMLRKAAELVNADKILFVSHTPATWELADSCIRIGAREAS